MNGFQKTQRIYIFDYLKAFAILLVIVNHYGQNSWRYLVTKTSIYPLVIQMAVPIFMIVTGCTFSISFSKKYTTLSEMYRARDLISKILRFWIPFFFAFLFEVVCSVFMLNMKFTPISLLKAFIVGGPGLNGSYYTPILIQLVFVYPLIYTLVKKYNTKGLWTCILINFTYEVLCSSLNISYDLYRVLMPRYITYVSLGTWLHLNAFKINKRVCLAAFVLGLIYDVIRLLGYKPVIFRLWSGTSMIIALYIFPVIAAIICKYVSYRPKDNMINKIALTIGNASFHIFLVQMIFYNVFNNYITLIINYPIVNIPLCLIICVTVGIGFYNIEKGISKKILSLI